MKTLYLAYGSNLSVQGMRYRCPDAKPVGSRLIKNAKLVFRGVADMVYHPGSVCPVGLWNISEEDEAALDRYEGVASGMYGRFTIPVSYKKKKRNALVYLMLHNGIYPPSQSYVDTIRRGYRDFKLDTSYLDEAIAHAFVEKAPSEQTEKRRTAQKQSTNQYRLVKMPEEVAVQRIERMQMIQQQERFEDYLEA